MRDPGPLHEKAPDAELRTFSRASAVLTELYENNYIPNVTFLDVEMPGLGGLELAQIIKEKAPQINVIFVTG